MGLRLAIKAFIKALKEPEKALAFVNDTVSDRIETTDTSHLRLLSALQETGRFVDFIKEDVSSFNDAQIGAVVRKIHQDCGSVIEDTVAVRPLRDEPEGTKIQILKGYNPAELKLTGKIKGEPPFTGVVVHRGWKAQKRSLPKRTIISDSNVICPAEIEIGNS